MYLQLAAGMWSSGENICIFMREEKKEKKNGWLDFQHISSVYFTSADTGFGMCLFSMLSPESKFGKY
jgi:hypothetical protein